MWSLNFVGIGKSKNGNRASIDSNENGGGSEDACGATCPNNLVSSPDGRDPCNTNMEKQKSTNDRDSDVGSSVACHVGQRHGVADDSFHCEAERNEVKKVGQADLNSNARAEQSVVPSSDERCAENMTVSSGGGKAEVSWQQEKAESLDVPEKSEDDRADHGGMKTAAGGVNVPQFERYIEKKSETLSSDDEQTACVDFVKSRSTDDHDDVTAAACGGGQQPDGMLGLPSAQIYPNSAGTWNGVGATQGVTSDPKDIDTRAVPVHEDAPNADESAKASEQTQNAIPASGPDECDGVPLLCGVPPVLFMDGEKDEKSVGILSGRDEHPVVLHSELRCTESGAVSSEFETAEVSCQQENAKPTDALAKSEDNRGERGGMEIAVGSGDTAQSVISDEGNIKNDSATSSADAEQTACVDSAKSRSTGERNDVIATACGAGQLHDCAEELEPPLSQIDLNNDGAVNGVGGSLFVVSDLKDTGAQAAYGQAFALKDEEPAKVHEQPRSFMPAKSIGERECVSRECGGTKKDCYVPPVLFVDGEKDAKSIDIEAFVGRNIEITQCGWLVRTTAEDSRRSNDEDVQYGVGIKKSDDKASVIFSGTPSLGGRGLKTSIPWFAKYKAEGAEHELQGTCVICINPRNLWKNLPFDKGNPYWAEDDESESRTAGDKAVEYVCASVRGRSHAHEGRGRDDNFNCCVTSNGWYVFAAGDGAGSAKYSRMGSRIACHKAVGYLKNILGPLGEGNIEDKELRKQLIYAAYAGFEGISQESRQPTDPKADRNGLTIRHYATTLMLVAARKFADGWHVASYWVGDGAAAWFGEDGNCLLLGSGRPDEGEFGGQTRFLTMYSQPDSQKILVGERARVDRLGPGRIYLLTDGVTDHYFENTEGLMNKDKWAAFDNEMKEAVGFANAGMSAEDRENGLAQWLREYRPRCHDDSTAVVMCCRP